MLNIKMIKKILSLEFYSEEKLLILSILLVVLSEIIYCFIEVPHVQTPKSLFDVQCILAYTALPF